MGKKTDIAGQRFGRLTVLNEEGRSKARQVLWKCKCDCGNEVTVRGSDLRSGSTQSCGCFQREIASERMAKNNTTHGLSRSRLYRVWKAILVRTGINKGADEEQKRDYIDRGITVCDEWRSFENFRYWALPHGYSDGLQIDRIDNDKGYCPENCRWVTPKENTNNRRNTLRLSDGTPLATFCSKIGIPTRENGKMSRQYGRIRDAYIGHHKAHPELVRKANETIALYRKCVEMLKLIAEVRQLRRNLTK